MSWTARFYTIKGWCNKQVAHLVVPIQNKINQTELRSDFEEFARGNENKIATPFSSGSPNFRPKSIRKPHLAHPNIDVCLSHKPLRYLNLSKKEL